MGQMSRNKGKSGERELVQELSRVLGVSARRGVQYSGGPDSPDVVTDLENVHIECKRTEHFRLHEALDQSIHDANGKTPVVMYRSNRRPWVVIVRLDDLPSLVENLNQFKKDKNDGNEN